MTSRLERIRKERISHLEALAQAGIDPFPARVQEHQSIRAILTNFAKLQEQGASVSVVGRIRSIREHGRINFFDLEDESGKIQLFFSEEDLKSEQFERLRYLDIGDFLWAKGSLYVTKAGEKSVRVKAYELLTKTLRPLPSQWYGLEDKEVRFRKRYLDLLMNKDVKQIFLTRFEIIRHLRNFLEKHGFVEVETPILQPLYGGASARPFKTQMNALDLELYLRIAPELYLKRLLVGGFERIYEIGRCFRNEGMDREHNPEFTMLEFYAAYWDWNDMMEFTEKMLAPLGLPVHWKRVEYSQIVTPGEDEKQAYARLEEPTFVLHLPNIPLAKRGEAAQGVVQGVELIKIFTEQNDPLAQRAAFEKSSDQPIDEDFIEALEYGMPPAAGFGMGIDRLTMILTEAKSLRESILFPTMKPTTAKQHKSKISNSKS